MAVVGIDLGTTYSAVAILRDSGPEIVPNADGDRTTPSVIGLNKSGAMLAGIKAKRSAGTLAAGPIEEVTRRMGTAEKVSFGTSSLSPPEVSAYILDKLVRDAEAHLGEKVNGAVITIPAYFQEPARAATREAGEIAGLVVGGILDEPSAAAIAYGLKKQQDMTILVYDFGGGTTDISLIQIAEGVFEVLAISGDSKLGGKDFDEMIVQHALEHIRKETGQDLAKDRQALALLRFEAEKTKKELSGSDAGELAIPRFLPDYDLSLTIPRTWFEDRIRAKVLGTKTLLQEALDKAEVKKEDIDNVLLVGGSTRIPLIQRTVREFMGKDPLKDINPDECVAIGAAVMTGVVKWPEEIHAREPRLPDISRMKDAEGNAVEVVPVLRTAHPLGIGIKDNRLAVIIDRGTQYPVFVENENFAVSQDGQTGIEIPVFEGDNDIASLNIQLGTVSVDLPPEARRAGERVAIRFTINADRILEVEVSLPNHEAVRAKATVESPGRLSEEERKRIVAQRAKQAAGGGGADVPRQLARQLIEEAKRMVKANREFLDPALVSKVEQLVVILQDAAESGNVKLIMEKGTELKAALDEIRKRFA